MKNKDKILNYYDDQLDVDKKVKFENEINESFELQEEFKYIGNQFEKIKNISNIKIDERYMANLLPRFYLNKDKKKKEILFKRMLVYTFSVLIVFVGLYFSVRNTNMDNTENIVLNLTQAEKETVLNNYMNESIVVEEMNAVQKEVQEKAIENKIIDEIISKDKKESKIHIVDEASIDDYEIFSVLSDEEKDKIYNEMLNKDIIQ